jgi:hypothetical protein
MAVIATVTAAFKVGTSALAFGALTSTAIAAGDSDVSGKVRVSYTARSKARVCAAVLAWVVVGHKDQLLSL